MFSRKKLLSLYFYFIFRKVRRQRRIGAIRQGNVTSKMKNFWNFTKFTLDPTVKSSIKSGCTKSCVIVNHFIIQVVYYIYLQIFFVTMSKLGPK